MVQRWQSRITVLGIGALVLLCPAMLRAQVTTATVYGNVTDGSGAQIPGAPVVIVNEETGSSQTATRSRTGEFTFNFNAFNVTSFSSLNTTITSTNFARVTGTRGARVVQLNARLIW